MVQEFQTRSRAKEQSLAAYERHLSAAIEEIQRSYRHAGTVIAAAENLAAIADSAWNPSRYDFSRAARIAAQRIAIVDTFNRVVSSWQVERQNAALMLGFYLDVDERNFGDEWRGVQSTIDRFIDCVRACDLATRASPSPKFSPCDCDSVRGHAWLALARFNRELRHSRIYNWEAWD